MLRMTFSRAALLRTVQTLRAFETTLSGSAYAGIQWGDKAPLLRRTSKVGYIESEGYQMTQPPALIVYLAHLRDCLLNLQDDEIDLENRSGVLTLSSSKGYVTELRVCTVPPDTEWMTFHAPGKPKEDIPVDGFKGIEADNFTLSLQPILRDHKLMLVTDFGVIVRNEVMVRAYPYPRDCFLKAIAGLPLDRLCMTEQSYWAAVANGYRIVVSGHRGGDEVFDLYNVASTPVAEFPAARLIQALTAAGNLAGKESRILLDPASGIIVRDQHRQDNRFSLGDAGGWSRFTILPKTAELLADTFIQDKEEAIIKLSRIDAVTMRFTRGPWQVSFKIIPAPK